MILYFYLNLITYNPVMCTRLKRKLPMLSWNTQKERDSSSLGHQQICRNLVPTNHTIHKTGLFFPANPEQCEVNYILYHTCGYLNNDANNINKYMKWWFTQVRTLSMHTAIISAVSDICNKKHFHQHKLYWEWHARE